MNLDTYAIMCSISAISVQAVVEAKRTTSFLEQQQQQQQQQQQH